VTKYLIAALFLAFGALALWGAFRVSSDIKKGRSWPTTPGKVLERRVGEPMGTRGRTFLPVVKYSYVVDGKEYTNDQVYLIKRSGGMHDKMQRLVDSFPDPVPVHYDPANPASSYLISNPTSTSWLLVGFGALALLLGLAQLLMIWGKTQPPAT
jgi:hypothetical protein